MKYRPTTLNIAALLLALYASFRLATDYAQLAKEEGWGLMVIIMLWVTCIVAVIIDFALQKAIKSPLWINIIGAIIITLFTLSIYAF